MSWTDERVERLSALWLEGRSASQIAAELGGGVSRNAVIGKVHRLGLSGRAVPPAAEAGPPRAREVFPIDLSTVEPAPAAALATDLSAMLPLAASPLAASPLVAQSEPQAAAAAIPAAVEAGEAGSGTPPAVAIHTLDDVASILGTVLEAAPEPITVSLPILRAARDVKIPVSDRVTILELSGSMCRWPIGDPTSAEFRFCGCRAAGTLPYCQEHARVAFQPVVDRRRAERLLRIA